MIKKVSSEDEMKILGAQIGKNLVGGEVIELVGDVGAGKTTLVKGIAVGLEIDEYIQSPSFTINRVYQARDGLTLVHYDFYRLDSAGILENEISEDLNDKSKIVIVEWGGVVDGVLPVDRLTIKIISPTENSREVSLSSAGESSSILLKGLSV